MKFSIESRFPNYTEPENEHPYNVYHYNLELDAVSHEDVDENYITHEWDRQINWLNETLNMS